MLSGRNAAMGTMLADGDIGSLGMNRAARYRDRAAEIRDVATALKDAAAREELRLIATEYELLAKHLERLLAPMELAIEAETAGYWATC
jgi:hypothetical protein